MAEQAEGLTWHMTNTCKHFPVLISTMVWPHVQPKLEPAPRNMALGYLLASAAPGGWWSAWDALAHLHSSQGALVEMQLLQLHV